MKVRKGPWARLFWIDTIVGKVNNFIIEKSKSFLCMISVMVESENKKIFAQTVPYKVNLMLVKKCRIASVFPKS